MFYEDDDMFEEQEDFGLGNSSNTVNQAIQAWQQMMMRKLVEENFEKIATLGFSEEQLQKWDAEELSALIETFNYMINEFEADEEYEKCATLVQARQAVIDRKAFKPIN